MRTGETEDIEDTTTSVSIYLSSTQELRYPSRPLAVGSEPECFAQRCKWANEARTLREKFTKIGVARLDRIDTIGPHYYPPALYWFMIDGLMDLTNYSGGWW